MNKAGRPKELNDGIVRTIMMETQDFEYLKSKGINMSKFFRQCVDNLRNGKIEYKY